MENLRKDDRKMLGRLGEDLAAAYLLSQNYRIVERNWRCRSGEVDIIADSGKKLIFVEVRTRRPSGRFGTAKESVDYRKQMKVREIAQVYLHRFNLYGVSVQFDVMTVELNEQQREPKIVHIQGAF